MRITDAQIHLWNGPDAPEHHWRAPFTIERALADMDAAGIDRAVNCPAVWDTSANDYAVTAATAHPDRFATLGWFPLDATAGPHLIDEWMAKPGMLGLRFLLFAPQVGDMIRSGALDWLWQGAHDRELPVAVMVMPEHLPHVGEIAARYPGMRLLIDHLAISPFEVLPGAAAHLDDLVALARLDNVAVKATAVPSIATDDYPFASTHDVIHRTLDAFGPARTFWGTDISRLHCSWSEAAALFLHELPWLSGNDLELVMGRGISDWIGWA